MKTITAITLTLFLLFITGNFTAWAQQEFDPVPEYIPKAKIDTSPVKLPEITKKTLKNGLIVYYIPHKELPVVSMRLLILSGSLYNPMDEPGLTEFMAGLLSKGTEKRTATQIAQEIDFIGGNLNNGAGWNGTYVQTDVLARDFEKGLDLLTDVALHPTFPEEEIERSRKQTLSSLMSNKDEPDVIADQQFNHFVYGEHPYAFPEEGTMESVPAFNHDSLVKQYKRLFVPGNAVFTVAGDFDLKKAHKLVERYFADWKSGDKPQPASEDAIRGAGGEILLIDKTDAVQSEIRLGYILGPYNLGEDYYAFNMMDYIFGGGGFSSRLMLRIRNELGLTYDIYSDLSAKQQAGAYTIGSFTKLESTGEIIDEIYSVMRKTIQEGFTEEELNDAKSFLVGQYPNRFEVPNQIATQFQTVLLYKFGDPVDHISRYRERIASVTLEDVNRMAKKYLHPDWLRITVVSNAEAVKGQLEKFGKIEQKSIDEL